MSLWESICTQWSIINLIKIFINMRRSHTNTKLLCPGLVRKSQTWCSTIHDDHIRAVPWCVRLNVHRCLFALVSLRRNLQLTCKACQTVNLSMKHNREPISILCPYWHSDVVAPTPTFIRAQNIIFTSMKLARLVVLDGSASWRLTSYDGSLLTRANHTLILKHYISYIRCKNLHGLHKSSWQTF